MDVLVKFPVEQVREFDHLLALFHYLNEFAVVAGLDVRHLPLPQRVDVAFHQLHVLLILDHHPAYLQQPFVEILGVEVSHVLFE
jgi:hypothetical protein